MNDITEGLSSGTNIAMYADDTKIWRKIACEDDHLVLQNDINYLLGWAVSNKMKFHPAKCKALCVSNTRMPFLDILPEIQYFYSMHGCLLDYTDCEKDLGIHVTSKLNWADHCDKIYSIANQRLGLMKRTCSFITNTNKRRALFLTQVRSQFDHCPIIWRPTSKSLLDKLESIQKRSIKWVLDEQYETYTLPYIYM